jgi:tripartite-type tricarboxylate transporter receptor subunit TctC
MFECGMTYFSLCSYTGSNVALRATIDKAPASGLRICGVSECGLDRFLVGTDMFLFSTSRRLLVALAVFCGSVTAHAETFPSRPITIVVPYPAGGVTDNLVRLLADRMKNTLGQSIVVENIGGGGGTIGVDRVSRAAPDGYTLVLGNSETMVFAPVTMAISYNALTDFAPVALLPSYPFLLVTTNDVPAKNLGELIAWFKSSPEKVLQGTVGAGTMQQLCGLLLQKTIGTKWQFVPYRGGPPAMQDLLAGQINFMCTTTGGFLQLAHDGRIRAYAVTARKRIAAAPDIPTANESGLPGFYTSVWNALWVPKGTPADVTAKLNAAVTAGLDDPELQKRMTDMGLDNVEADQRTPEALEALRAAEIDKWWPIIKAAGLKAE